MDSTYSSGYGWLRTESAAAYQALSRALEDAVMNNMQNNGTTSKTVLLLKESVQSGFKSLEALGVEVIDKEMDSTAVGQDIDLPISGTRAPYEASACVSLCLSNVARFCVLGNLGRAEMWMRAALWIEGVWGRDTIELFKLQWSEALVNIGEAAIVILDKIALSREKE